MLKKTLWLDLLRSFVAVENIYLSEQFTRRHGTAFATGVQEPVGEKNERRFAHPGYH